MKQKKGFTLTELIIVIAIIAIMSAILIPTVTGYINRARENNALVEMSEINKIYQLWKIENGDKDFDDIYSASDDFVAYLTNEVPECSNRINYSVLQEQDSVVETGFHNVNNVDTTGKVIFLYASNNGLFGTCSVAYKNTSLGSNITNLGVYPSIQQATNETFGGENKLQVSTDKWEYTITENTFDFTSNRYLISLYSDSKEDNHLITEFYVRAGKIFTKQYLDKKCSSVNYYVYKEPQNDTYELNGFNIKSSIIRWDYSDGTAQSAWNYSLPVQNNISLIAVADTDIVFDEVAIIQRNTGSEYKEYEQGIATELILEIGFSNYYFDDINLAISFADQYVSQETYYYYEVDAESSGCSTSYVPHENYSSINYKNNVTLYDIIEVKNNTSTIISSNATLKAGCKLLLPCDDGKYGNVYTPALYTDPWYSYIEQDPFTLCEPSSKITVASNITFDVYGEIELAAYTTTKANEVLNQVYVKVENGQKTAGGFSVLENNGTINMKQNSKLTSYGYVTGNGNIIAEDKSTLVDLFVIYNWPGGSASSVIYKTAFIFNEYAISNIRCNSKIYSGAEYLVFAAIYIPSMEETETECIKLIGSDQSSLFSFTSNNGDFIEKNWVNGVVEIVINGSIADNYFGINGLSLRNVYFPVYKMNIIVESGTFNIKANKFMITPGSSITVKENANVVLSDTGGIAVMDSITISNENEKNTWPTTPGCVSVYGTIGGEGELVGTFNVMNNGSISTANIIKVADVIYGKGKVVKVSDSYPLQTDRMLLSIVFDNEENNLYTIDYVTDSDTVLESSLVAHGTITNLEPLTKDGYTFDGWFTSLNFEPETQVSEITVTESISLYAKWSVIE